MYSLPGYITHYKQDNATYVVSNLYKNVVKLTDHNIQKEFDEIVSCCPDILQCMNLRCARNRIIENKITSHCNLSKLNLY